ncbi:MAG: hypothetical protein GKR97_05000 [Rhizobiaceae bacterium]|nr:hypothetical protein [Rhizobiaceae bacterium]
MSNAGIIFLLFVSSLSNSLAQAQFTPGPLSPSEIQIQLLGHSLIGEYSSGARWSEQLHSNMTSTYVEDDSTMHGVMDFIGPVLCFTYSQSDDPNPHCFEIWKRGANCFDFYGIDDIAGLSDRRFGRGWLARAWKTDRASTCQSDLIG